MHRFTELLLLLITGTVSAQPYFQQQVDYVIDVRLDDRANLLHGAETFTYHNNSPTALDTLWIHLWPNAYRDRNTALCRQKDAQNDFDLHFAKEEERGWIDSLDFRAAGSKLNWDLDAKNQDIAWIKLNEPLAPGGSIQITTPFQVKIPDAKFSRLGHTRQAYYITQWYPKPAVYDAQGWHAMPYLNQGEFYSEFGSFDVSITLPANYVVGATGLLQDNPSEEAWMDSLAQLPPPTTRSNAFPPSAASTKTLRFKQDHVHDFAWFADKRFLVRNSEVTLARSGRKVQTQVLFTPQNAPLWKDAVSYVNESVRLYSQWVGDYQYARCTAIDGTIAAGGGMEYPMITIIGNMAATYELDQVIAHEVGHNWFYGMLASNERDHPWMDEGMNSFFEQRYMETRYPNQLSTNVAGLPMYLIDKHFDITFRRQNELMYRYNARRNWDAPDSSTSTAFTEVDYGTTVYAKSALIFDQLRSYLGDARFDSCTQAYFREWAGKHPQPADVRASYEKASGEDLGWCFGELIGTADKVDVKARKLKNGELTYRSTAATDFPFPVTAWNGADSLGTAWIKGEPGRNNAALPWPNADRVRIDAMERTLDIDRRNNEARSFGLLKNARLPQLKFLAGLERNDRRSIYWLPAIGYNAHDGFMAGLALHNTTFPSQRLEWAAAPLYGFQSNRLAGCARVMWNHDRLRSNWLRNIHIGLSGFAASLHNVSDVEQWYQRLVPSIQFDPKLNTTGPEAYLRYRSVILWEHAEGTYHYADREVPINSTGNSVYHELSANLTQRNGFNPYSLTLTSLNADAFSRLALEAKWSAIYDTHKHRITFRAFAGTFLRKDRSLMTAAMGWRMYWGSSDLLYDHLYLDRQYTGQNTSAQFNIDQGGFRTPTSIGTSDTWIAALNTEIDFPFALPLAAFASYGAAPVTLVTQDGKTTDWRGNWEAGIGLRLWRDMVEVWVPLAFSEDIQKEQELRGFDFTDRIRFVLALEKMDPTQALRKLPH
ncbi:MAG: M1 family metallopeptidase [Bacteroidetes bacterium]|nr:M1 family metallopeptidase [Bacteroidota bacterium]MBS1941341.1 M1 family metallopeptidase [Bacteroidota bacterium]